MDNQGQSRKKKSVRERAQEVQLYEILRGDLIRLKNYNTDEEINKYLADAEAGDVEKYRPFSSSGIRDPLNSPITPQNRCHFCDYEPTLTLLPGPGAKKTLLRCSACKAVKYCDRECQSKDWKFHKKGCALIRSDPKGLGDKMIAPST